jgi:type VI secretion system protein ImpA
LPVTASPSTVRRQGSTPPSRPTGRRCHEQALQLAARTRDLRVAVWLARSGARVRGLAGAVDGLRLIEGLVERHWEHVHPPLDASDNNDPTARVMALTALADPLTGLADVRAASLTGKRGALTVRDIELALGAADAMPGESVPTVEGVLEGVSASLAEMGELAASMQAGYDAAQSLAESLDRHIEASHAPDLAPLKKVLQRVADAARKARGEAAVGEDMGPLRPTRRVEPGRSLRARTPIARSSVCANGSSATSRAIRRRSSFAARKG